LILAQEQWTSVDCYFNESLLPGDSVLDEVLRLSSDASLPAHNVSPNQGKLLMLYAQMINARNILEIGTLGGYSTIWLARGLCTGGRVVTLEANAKHAEVSRVNFRLAGLSNVIDLRLGLALDSLPKLASENTAPFDLIFIDADKPNNPHYFEWALKLARSGTVIVVDNVVREGAVVDRASSDANVQGVRGLVEMLAVEKRVNATAIQTVGSKGYDGFVIGIVK
jgi:predicted O-methyltransferase YrrM